MKVNITNATVNKALFYAYDPAPIPHRTGETLHMESVAPYLDLLTM